jgi:hypothetical protein
MNAFQKFLAAHPGGFITTFFEGHALDNARARGYSRDHRPDGPQVCIGLVVRPEGLPLAEEVSAGNRADVTRFQVKPVLSNGMQEEATDDGTNGQGEEAVNAAKDDGRNATLWASIRRAPAHIHR